MDEIKELQEMIDKLRTENSFLKEELAKTKSRLYEANAIIDSYDAEIEYQEEMHDPYEYYGVRRSDF